MIISLSGTSLLKGMVAGVAGILLATVGMDPLTGTPRLYFGNMGLIKGLDLIPVLVGLFGIGEILDAAQSGTAKIYDGTLGKMTPRGEDLKRGLWASLRGSILGFFVGLFPGMGPVLSSFFSYDLEKRISRHPHKFGRGAIEGVAGPEAANNATATAGFIPMMVFGIPIGPALAMILAAMMLHGLQPGPLLFSQHSDFVWTVIGSMYLGNIMLLVLNLPLVGVWARISLIPYKILGPIILAIAVVGAYSPRNTLFDVWVALAFGLLGLLMRRFRWPLAPLILGFILGELFEKSLRQSLSMSSGSLMVFLNRPIAALFIGLTVIAVIVMLKFRISGQVYSEEGDVIQNPDAPTSRK
jgi:putative tricarboxylic transport membrane protein